MYRLVGLRYALNDIRVKCDEKRRKIESKFEDKKDLLQRESDMQLNICQIRQQKEQNSQLRIAIAKRLERLDESRKSLDCSRRQYEESNKILMEKKSNILNEKEMMDTYENEIIKFESANVKKRVVFTNELFQIYPILETKEGYTIQGLYIFKKTGTNLEDEAATALGYVSHVIKLLTGLFNIPIKYSIYPGSSRSFIRDDLALPEKPIYPLFFSRGNDKAKYMKGIGLLNANILQMLRDIGFADEIDESMSDPMQILANLKLFIECIQ
jgi:hypothetical protein